MPVKIAARSTHRYVTRISSSTMAAAIAPIRTYTHAGIYFFPFFTEALACRMADPGAAPRDLADE